VRSYLLREGQLLLTMEEEEEAGGGGDGGEGARVIE